MTSPARSIRRTPSARSLPATSLSLHSTASPSNSVTSESVTGARNERKANTDPGSQRNRIKQMTQAKVQKYTAGMHSLHTRCMTVPEEESSATSLQLPASSLRPNMVPSFQPQSHVRAGQNWSDSKSEVCLSQSRNQIPSTIHVAEHYRLGNAASGAHTPTRPGRSPSNVRPFSSLSINNDTHWQSRHRSATPRDRESVSTPASDQWSANLQDPDIMEEPSFSLSELEESREYSSSSLPHDVQSRCSTATSGLNYPCLHNHHYPHNSEAALSAYSNPFPMCHHSGSAQCPAHSSCCSLPTMTQSPLYPSAHSAFQYPGQQHNHMTTPNPYQYRKQG